MDAGAKRIPDIFNGSRVLEIPFFQRAYVWGEEQWERLLEDVETVSRNNKPYFMGSVILKQQQTNTQSGYGDMRTVIDGQQRLTTLSILLKVLCLKTGQMSKFDKRFRLDDETTVLKHNHNDIAAFTDIMDLTSEIAIEKKDNITDAYNYFRKNLDPAKVNFEAILDNILLVGIDLNIDEDEQEIFDTINSIGVKLTTAELLKNFFFGRDDLPKYEKYWKELFEKDEETKEYWDKEITAGRNKRSFIDIFFHSYLQIKINDSSLSVKADDKIKFSKVDKLFESYKQFIKGYYGGQKDQLLVEIKKYALSFIGTFNPSVVDAELPAKSGIDRINAIIFGLETTTLIPYILFIENNINDDDDVKNELYGFIESFIMRRMIDRATTKNYNQLFYDRLIFNRILSKQEFLDYLQKQDDKANYLPSDAQLENAMKTSVLTNKQAAGVLYLIESSIRDRLKHSTQLLGLNKYSLEHVMPKKWRNHWTKPDTQVQVAERDRKLLTLGNLTIITQALNASIRDADWEFKKAGRGNASGLKKYAEGIDTFSEYLDNPDWNEEVIDERAAFLLDKALMVWKVPNQGVNRDYYVNYGLDVRSWEDALKYGFISAGGGQWYSGPLNNLEVGNRIWAYIPGTGYVGVGIVTHTAKRASETMISVNGKDENFFDLQLTADYHKGQTADKEEYIVRVKWIKTVSKDEAVLEKNFFSNQNTAARPIADSWHYTIARLKQIWGIDD